MPTAQNNMPTTNSRIPQWCSNPVVAIKRTYFFFLVVVFVFDLPEEEEEEEEEALVEMKTIVTDALL